MCSFYLIEKSKMLEQLFTQKYNPQKLQDIVLPEKIKRKFIHGIDGNFIFSGMPGLGKTTLANILIKRFNAESLYINASIDGRIDIIREKILTFGKTFGLKNPDGIKIVFLDEADASSNAFFKALRGTLDKVTKNVRFIITCNYLEKIPKPIQSRFQLINFSENLDNVTLLELYKKIHSIAKKEQINISKKVTKTLVDLHLPDIRSILISLQGLKGEYGDKEITEKIVKTYNPQKIEKVFKFLLNTKINPEKTYELVYKFLVNDIEQLYTYLGTTFIEYIITNAPQYTTKIPVIIRIVAEYMHKHKLTLDTSINLNACLFEIQLKLHTNES